MITSAQYTVKYLDSSTREIIYLKQCSQILANSNCELLIMPPKTSIENPEASILLKAKHAGHEINKIINFKRVINDTPGIFFYPNNSLKKNTYATVYLYGDAQQNYQIINILGTNIEKTLLRKGYVLPVEVKMDHDYKLIVHAQDTQLNNKYILPLNLKLAPDTDGPLLTSSIVPIIKTTTGSTTGSMVIVNSGNQNTASLMVNYPTGATAATGSGACNLAAGLATQSSCILYFTITSPGIGNGSLNISDGVTSLNAMLSWYNVTTGITAQMSASPASVTYVGSGNTTVTVVNNGPYTLTGISVSATKVSGPATSTSISSNTCSSLAASSNCTFTLTVSGGLLGTGVVYASITGMYNNGLSSSIYNRILGINYTAILY